MHVLSSEENTNGLYWEQGMHVKAFVQRMVSEIQREKTEAVRES